MAKLATFLRRYWFVIALGFTGQAQLTLAIPKDAHKNTTQRPSQSKDLVQILRSTLPKDKYTQWIFNLLFTPPVPPTTATITTYLPYAGRTIGNIHLDKHDALPAQAHGKRSLLHIMLPVTKNGALLNLLAFSIGDVISPQKLVDSQALLNKPPYIKEAVITVQEREDDKDTVDVHITTKDRFPISTGLDVETLSVFVTHNNLLGWGHLWKNQVFYDQGLGYGTIYRASNIKQSGVTGELLYVNVQNKGIKSAQIFKEFTHQTDYAFKVEE